MIHVDESDPVGEIEPSFPYRDVAIKRGVEAKEFYDLESEIGRGKFGTVYRCRERATGLTLAAKFVSVPRRDDRRNVEREVEIMRMLQHPRLIQLYDAFDNGKVMCVVLELIEGGELFERVIDDDFILTEKSCTVFMRQICEGIEFVHKQNILHLDMKPENILCLTKTGNRIKIIDFGLARKYDPHKKLQVLFGTPEFVAPEVVNFDQIGYGTDMWSVGVICYVLLSGLSPFMGETDIETMANVTIAKYDFDDEAFSEISQEAKDFITKLLVKDKEARTTASDCLAHPWLRRIPRPPIRRVPVEAPGLDTAKDNLRAFVERWGEHPNSPYLFDVTSHLIAPCPNLGIELTASQHSLRGMSPSPCGSLGSSPECVMEEDLRDHSPVRAFDKHNFEHSQNLERRASDSSCVVKRTDMAEKVNLAEEIKKLSDKLFKLATMPTELTNGNTNGSRTKLADLSNGTTNGIKDKLPDVIFKSIYDKNSLASTDKLPPDSKLNISISSKMTNGKTDLDQSKPTKPLQNGRILKKHYSDESNNASMPELVVNGDRNDEAAPPGADVPWANIRRAKFKLTGRDVPITPTSNGLLRNNYPTQCGTTEFYPNNSTTSSASSSHIIRQSSTQNAANTKDLLLQLLDKWDDTQDNTVGLNGRHKSISMEWSENESLGPRTISSLNTFFQSRQTMKKTHTFNAPN